MNLLIFHDFSGNLDLGLRLLSYSCALYAQYLSSKGHGETNLVKLLTQLFERVTDARFISHFFNFPKIIQWFSAAKGIEKVMALSMLIYFPIEHTWWLTTLNPGLDKFINVNGDHLSQLSSRVWGIYIMLDLFKQKKRMEQVNVDKVEKSRIKLQLQSCLCDLIIATQYSSINRPFPDVLVNIAGAYGGFLGLYLQLTAAGSSTPKAKSE